MNKHNLELSGQGRCFVHISAYLLFAIVVMLICPWIGGESLDLRKIADDLYSSGKWGVDTDILLNFRIPRLLLGFLTGGCLAIVGCAFQVILRNPLATPYTLAVTGGAATGAYAAIAFPVLSINFGPFSSVQVFAFIGAAIILLLVYTIARRPGGISMDTLLLAGITLGILCGALILLIRYVSNPNVLVSMDRWIMGGLDIVGYRQLLMLLPFLLPGVGLLVMQTNSLNHLSMGEQIAAGYGVDVTAVQRWSFLAGSLATASVVSVAGPIGFVGLLIPHIVRRISGYDHRIVIPGSFFLGGGFLVVCDTFARTIVAPTEMPVGVITALIGGPFFIYLLVRKKY